MHLSKTPSWCQTIASYDYATIFKADKILGPALRYPPSQNSTPTKSCQRLAPKIPPTKTATKIFSAIPPQKASLNQTIQTHNVSISSSSQEILLCPHLTFHGSVLTSGIGHFSSAPPTHLDCESVLQSPSSTLTFWSFSFLWDYCLLFWGPPTQLDCESLLAQFL